MINGSLLIHDAQISGFAGSYSHDVAEAVELARAHLMGRGMSDRDVKAMGLRVITPAQAVVLGVNTEGQVGVVIPYPECGDFFRVRLLPGGARKYTQASGSTSRAYFPPGFDKGARTVLITEGEFKAYAAQTRGLHTIGLGGVSSGVVRGTLIPDLQAISWHDKIVMIVYDSDNDVDRSALGKHGNSNSARDVAQAEIRLVEALKGAGASIVLKARVGMLAGDRAGKFALDDWLPETDGSPDDLLAMLRTTVNAQGAGSRFIFAGAMETSRTVVIGEKTPISGADDIAYVGTGANSVCSCGAIDPELMRYVRKGVTFYVEDRPGARRFAAVARAHDADVVLCTEVGDGNPEDFPVVEMTEDEERELSTETEIARGTAVDQVELSPALTLEEMLDRFVYVKHGHQVVDTHGPNPPVYTTTEAMMCFSSSKTLIPTGRFNGGSPVMKSVSTFEMWQSDARRVTTDTVTFWPGAATITTAIDGRRAYNVWRPHLRGGATADPQTVIDHIRMLFGDRADDFMAWLAFAEQKPGAPCGIAWLHISSTTGTGRNLLAEFLARVWPRSVALNADIESYLGVGFNGEMSRKILTVVDEIKEGGHDKWSNAEKLKKATTATFRKIKPKYGHEIIEYDANRLLVFSNHLDALPIAEEDRRFEVSIYNGTYREPAYYEALANEMRRPSVVQGFAKMLAEWDLQKYSPERRSKNTEDRRTVLDANIGELGSRLKDLMERHPEKVGITPAAAAEFLGFNPMTKEFKGAIRDAGMDKLRIMIGETKPAVFVLRTKTLQAKRVDRSINDYVSSADVSAEMSRF